MTASVRHRAAGVTIAADRPLPGLPPASPAHECSEDVRIDLQSRPAWHDAAETLFHAAADRDAASTPVVTVSRSPFGFHFSYADGTEVWIDSPGARVWCTWTAAATLADTCTYLAGPILGFVLRLRGALSLHASAVQIGARAVGFVGPHGAGKSTIAAALGAGGHAVITDDVLHLRDDGGWFAEPFASMLRLWPDGAHLALGPEADLPPIVDGWDKRALFVGERVPAASDPVPLAALICLLPSGDCPSIAPLSAGTALLRLAANSSAAHLLDSSARAIEFRALERLVRTIPCAAVSPPIDRTQFPSFVSELLAWVRGLDDASRG